MWLLLTKSSLLIKSQESAIQAPKIKKNTRIFSMVTVFESSAEKTRKKKKKKSTHTSQIGSSCMYCCAKELSLTFCS